MTTLKDSPVRLEHANITVVDIDKALAFIRILFPEFEVRSQGVGENGKPWLHIGNDYSYIAMQESESAPVPTAWRRILDPGVNHFGFAVGSIEPIKQRLESSGYEVRIYDELPYRRRLYVYDDLEYVNEWELVEYFSDDPKHRNFG